MEEILSRDIVNEAVSRNQVNTTIAGMLTWGYLICAAVTIILFMTGNESKLVEALLASGRINGPFGEINKVNWLLWGSGAITFIALVSIYWTANVVAHMISFHVSAIVLSPLLLSILNGTESGRL